MINIRQKNISSENITKIIRLQSKFYESGMLSYYPNNSDEIKIFLKNYFDENTKGIPLVIYLDLNKKYDSVIINNKKTDNIFYTYYYKIKNEISDITSFEENIINNIHNFSKTNMHCTFTVTNDFMFDEVFRVISRFKNLCKEYKIEPSFSYDIEKLSLRGYLRFSHYLLHFDNLIPYSKGNCSVCQYNYVVKNNKFYYCEKMKMSKIFNLNNQKFVKAFLTIMFWKYFPNKMNKNFFNLRSVKKESNQYGCFLFGNKINTIYNHLGDDKFKN